MNLVSCRLVNIRWCQREKSRTTSFYSQLLSSVSTSQEWWWCTWLAANYSFCGLGGIPRVARSVLQAWKNLHHNISKRTLIHPSSCHVALLSKGFIMLWNQCYLCGVCGTSTDVQDLLSRQMVPALSGNSRNLHPTNRNAAAFHWWSLSTFCFRSSLKSASWQAGILPPWSEELFQCLSTVSTDFRCNCRSHVRVVLSHPLNYVWTVPVLTGLLDVSSQIPVRLRGPLPKTQW